MSTPSPSAAERVYVQVKREILGGALPGGSFVTEIRTETPETEVTDSGEVVEIGKGK